MCDSKNIGYSVFQQIPATPYASIRGGGPHILSGNDESNGILHRTKTNSAVILKEKTNEIPQPSRNPEKKQKNHREIRDKAPSVLSKSQKEAAAMVRMKESQKKAAIILKMEESARVLSPNTGKTKIRSKVEIQTEEDNFNKLYYISMTAINEGICSAGEWKTLMLKRRIQDEDKRGIPYIPGILHATRPNRLNGPVSVVDRKYEKELKLAVEALRALKR